MTLLKINYRILVIDFLTVLFFIFLSFGAFIYAELFVNNNFKYLIFIISALSLGFWFHAFHLFLHEATHYNLHHNRKINDIISDILFIPTLGLRTKHYRKYHWEHHKNLGTVNDTENSYFTDLSILNLIKSLIPIFTILEKFKSDKKIIFYYYFKIFKPHILIFACLFHASIELIIYFNNLKYSSIIYLLSILVIFPLLAKIRQKLEHRNEMANTNIDYTLNNHGEYNRIFSDNFFSRFFGSAGFNKHFLHHINPSCSYTNFREYETFIKNSNIDLHKKIIDSKTTYVETFLKLVRY